MSALPISMRKLKEILRLKYRCQLSHRQMAKSLSISPSVVSRYLNQAAQLGITDYPLAAEWNELNLRATFRQTPVKKKASSLPDWTVICQEMKHKTMTLQLLWEKYQQQNPVSHYTYAHFFRLYKSWLQVQSLVMRQTHKAGEKLFVDYCGSTLTVTDPKTGEQRTAQVFVAVLGASNYTYAEAN